MDAGAGRLLGSAAMRTWMAILLVVAGVVACGGDPAPDPDRPAPPDSNDPAFTVKGAHSWYLIGDALTPGDDTMTVIITAPAGTLLVDAYVGDHKPVRMSSQSDGFGMQVSIADIVGDERNAEYVIPSVFDTRVVDGVAEAVKRKAIEEGLARRTILAADEESPSAAGKR